MQANFLNQYQPTPNPVEFHSALVDEGRGVSISTQAQHAHYHHVILLQVECRNYIRTLHKINTTSMYVCGTNAFSPTCDYLVSVEEVWARSGLLYH